MSHNNSMSFQSGNEFMPSDQKNQGPSFDQFMQTCFNNPAFFESMKHFYLSQSQKTPTAIVQNNQSSQGYQQQQNSSFNYAKQAVLREEESRGEEYEKELSVRQSQDIKKKPANPLAKFVPPQSTQSEKPKPNQPYSKPSQPQKIQSFDDKPIKSNFTASIVNNSSSFDLNAIKENKSINVDNLPKKVVNYDEIPIKGAKQYQSDNYTKQEGQEKNHSGINYAMDERPLTGCAKDFKQLLKEKFPDAIVPEGEDQDQLQEKKEHRSFLKRGSRQHLSSALNKSKQPKKDTSMTKSELEDNRSITPRRNAPEGRSTSQNRVLAKKNANQTSSRVIPKAPAYNDQSFDEDLSTKAKPPANRQRPPKPDPPSTRAADKVSTKGNVGNNSNKKKKTKNVFNDESQQSSSSSEEQQAPYFKASQKKPEPALSSHKYNIRQSEDLIEVIDGVHLTKLQLDEIIQKYGKVQTVVKETESEKLSALRKKYNEMMALMEEQREQNKAELDREKEEFQRYKAEQMNKIKNERRVMERQVKSTMGGHAAQKEKEQLEQLRLDLQREREQTKRKQKNSRIMLDKYKKENQELKSKLERLELDRDNKSMTSKRSATTIRYEDDDKVSVSKANTGAPKAKKVEEELKAEDISYKDIKKGKASEQKETAKTKQTKYEYIEEDSRLKNKSIAIKNQSISFKNEPKEKKVTNKWASQKFDSQSEKSASQSEGDDNISEVISSHGVQWSPTMKLSDLCKINLSIKMVTDHMIKSLFRHQNNLEFVKYQQSLQNPSRTVVNTTRNARNDYTAKLYSDRSKELIYDNGTRKVSFQNGYSLVYFKNGDIKQTLPDKTVLYYFKQKQVDQITLPNGVNIYRFENNQVQFHFDNGYIEIRHPDGTIKVLGGEHTRR